MKKTFILALALATCLSATAQVTVELVFNQEQFLSGEPMPLAAKVVNRSGQKIHLGAEANWLTFNVESLDGLVVIKSGEVPVLGEFDLESSQQGTKHVDIAPYFTLSRPGRYKVIATLRIKDWSAQTASAPVMFDIVTGAKLWTQEFGVPNTSNAVPEMRKYTLEQANYLNSQMRLYVQLSDASESRIYKTTELGQTVSFSRPEAIVDHYSLLHVLWQSGAQAFSYLVVDSTGNVIRRETYDDFNNRPRLTVSQQGDPIVLGGIRRPKPGEIPVIQAPKGVPSKTDPAPDVPAGPQAN
jgi:hypothetical protein